MRAVITFVVAALLLVTSISTESASAATKVASTTYTEALTNGKNFLSEHTAEQGEDRLGISVSAAEKIKALALPSDIPKALQRWLKNEKTAMIAFVRLQLTKAGTKLFDNPQFVPWLKYADDLSAQTGKPSAAISTLTAQYGDDALARLINQAVKDSRTKDTALRLQAEQLHHWLANKRSPDEVFKLLELDQAGNGILRNPLFRTWLNYLNKFNHENPSMKASLITPLYKHYSNMRVSIMVKEASKGDQEAVIVARIVENEHWLSNRKTPEAAFVSLRLIKPRDNFLTSNRFGRWVKYLNDYHQRYPDKTVTMLDVLRIYHTDEALSQMIKAAKNVPEAKKVTTTLQISLLIKWVRARKDPKDVSLLLGLEASDALMQAYVKKFNQMWRHAS